MHLEATKRFMKDYQALPLTVREQVKQILQQLEQNPFHPSLHHKKMEGYPDIYEVRVTLQYRITYRRIGSIGYLRRVGPHDILRRP